MRKTNNQNPAAAVGCKPFLRWAGSKRKAVPLLSQYWDSSYKRYVEPFAGSAVLFFHLKPAKALLSDINGELINCLLQTSEQPHQIYDLCQSIPVSRDQYNHLRQISPSHLTPLERAIRFLYLNRNCFNGIYRTNLKGEFNVPFSGKKTGSLPPRDDFLRAAELLSKATIVKCDFESILAEHVTKGDFVYLDPPLRHLQAKSLSGISSR